MSRVIVPTNDDVARFVSITGDYQRLHDPAYMNGLGYEAIVPAMMLMGYAVQDLLSDNTKSLTLNFSDAVSVNDKIFIAGITEGDETTVIGDIEDGKSFLEDSSFSPQRKTPDLGSLLVGSFFVPQENDVISLEDALGFEGGSFSTSKFIYVLSYSSKALLDWISKDDDLNMLAFNGEKNLPVYSKINLFMPKGPNFYSGKVNYYFSAEQTGKREFNLGVRAKTPTSTVFEGNFVFSSVPEKIILRKMAKRLS